VDNFLLSWPFNLSHLCSMGLIALGDFDCQIMALMFFCRKACQRPSRIVDLCCLGRTWPFSSSSLLLDGVDRVW
jgi:hypothetical protein